jgi:hypothetical protein
VGFLFAQVWASPFHRRLASQRGRIEFAFATDDSVTFLLRDNLDETGATIMMRRGGRMG